MNDKSNKVTYYLKDDFECPICDTKFQKEEILSGGGRMNAGKLTDELHRNYKATVKFGEIFPLIYPVATCPNCYYSAFSKDFFFKKGDHNSLVFDIEKRKNAFKRIFPDLDFESNRTLKEGIASYFYAMMCYDYLGKETCPTLKQSLCAIRGAWLCKDLHRKFPGENYDYLAAVFYRKASFFYNRVIEKESTGEENITMVPHLGPDIDKNYGYDGILYLAGLLEVKYGQRQDPERRIAALKKSRSIVARIVGMGRSSKSKPSVILDLSRDLHKNIKEELEALGGA